MLAAIAAAGVDAGRPRPRSSTAPRRRPTPCSSASSPSVGLITTRGFRDVLELGRRTRPQPYGMTGTFEPLIPRELRLEVAERMDARGRGASTPLDEAAVDAAARALLAAGCEALVIHFLHAYANPAHELRAGEIARALWPNAYVTLGHALLSEYREYERGTTASVNAAVQPVLDRYIAPPAGRARRRAGFARDLLVMNGNGGTVPARARRARGGEDGDVRPGLGRDGGGGDAGGEPGVAQRHHLRHGRHLHRRRADPRRRAGGLGRARPSTTACRSTCRWWTCAPSAPAAARSPAIDAAGMLRVGPGERGRDAGADLLRPRRHAAHHHRRQSGARPARPGRAARGATAGRRRQRCARPSREQIGAPLGLDASRRPRRR